MKDAFNIVRFYDRENEDVPMTQEKSYIPVYGKISCGYPKFIDDNYEGCVEIPYHMIGEGDYFVLKSSGNSMVNAGINDGDLILVKKQNYAVNGQIVVAVCEGDVTLKRFYYDKTQGLYRLCPENSEYEEIRLKDIEILGVAVKVVKDL